jgi:hypothetical protein
MDVEIKVRPEPWKIGVSRGLRFRVGDPVSSRSARSGGRGAEPGRSAGDGSRERDRQPYRGAWSGSPANCEGGR